jgi:hypothetical protein
MGLEENIGSFSKRRGTEDKNPYAKHDTTYDKYEDEDYYEDDYDEEDINPHSKYNFKMYDLSQLDQLNQEIEETPTLLVPFWLGLKHYFKKGALTRSGLVLMKIKKLVGSDNFEGTPIHNVRASLSSLNTFSNYLYRLHKRRTVSNLMSMILFGLALYWTGWTIFWSIMLLWYFVDIVMIQFAYKKRKIWVESARKYIALQEESEILLSNDEESNFSDVMAFSQYVNQQNQESWSVKLYDAIAKLFKK